MAQSSVTVTPNNPTPPTNMVAGYVNAGKFTPGPPTADYASTVYNDPWHPGQPNPTGPTPPGATTSTLPPYLDDGAATSVTAFGAPASGTASEGAGTEVVVTQTYGANILNPAGPLVTVSDLGSYVGLSPTAQGVTTSSPNQQHASSLSPAANPTLASINPTTAVHAASGSDTITCTGTNFTRQSVVYANGVAQPTTYVSATSITAAVKKNPAAGTWPITVITGGSVTTAAQTLTYS